MEIFDVKIRLTEDGFDSRIIFAEDNVQAIILENVLCEVEDEPLFALDETTKAHAARLLRQFYNPEDYLECG